MLRLLLASLPLAARALEGPCDITARAGQPCVAAHSTVRALYHNYAGPLYQLLRSSDNKSLNVSCGKGGFADIAPHEAFCSKGDCNISLVYDQSPMGNHLHERAGHALVNASQHKVAVRGNVTVYGMWFDPGYGYWANVTTGVAVGNEEESIFAVMSGTHFSSYCCFDYGNAETDGRDDGCGTMEAIYFGNAHWHGNKGSGKTGPWVGADLEQGMYYGGGKNRTIVNEENLPLTHEFVTAYLRGETDGMAIKGGDATSGSLVTMYEGPRPDRDIAARCKGKESYQPMKKQGAVILATGGGGDRWGAGKFYEGFMTKGATGDATDAAVQANIVAVGYRSLGTEVAVVV